MRFFLADSAVALKALEKSVIVKPFECFVPFAKVNLIELPGGKLCTQVLQNESLSISTYEIILDTAGVVGVEHDSPRLSLLFALRGSLLVEQNRLGPYGLAPDHFALVYWPSHSRLNILPQPGASLFLQVDFHQNTLRSLAEDFPKLNQLIRASIRGSTLGRRLDEVPMDAFVRLSIRQIFEYAETKSERSLFIQARFLDLLRHYLHALRPQQDVMYDGQGSVANIMRLKTYIDEHLDLPLAMPQLASSHGLSVRSMERHFQQQFGQSIGRYIADRRMARAQASLKETMLPLLSIALMVGYSELSNFTRAFKAYYGYQPSRLRS